MRAFVRVSAEGIPVPAVAADSQRPTKQFRMVFAVLTFGYPVLWAIGLGGFYWSFLGLAGLAYLTAVRAVSRSAYPLIAVVGALVLSVPVGVVAFGADVARVVSVGGNILVWVACAALLTLAERSDLVGLLLKTILVTGICHGAVELVAAVLYPATVPLPLLEGLANALPSGPAAFAARHWYSLDWFGYAAFRSSGMMAQPTWGGVFGALTIIAAIASFRLLPRWRWVACIALAAGVFALQLSLSRSTEICLAVALIVAVVTAVARRNRLAGTVIGIAVATAAAAVLLAASRQIAALAVDVNDVRVGSLDARSAIYARTWQLFTQLPFPLLGYGVKPKESMLVASVATHSSYLGMLFRAGLLGEVALVLVFVVVLLQARRVASPLAVALVVFCGSWCVLEDFDPGHLMPLGYVLAFARVVSLRTTVPPPSGRPEQAAASLADEPRLSGGPAADQPVLVREPQGPETPAGAPQQGD